MNILVLGNGFDLNHGLPTRYTDFLTLIKFWGDFKVSYENSKKSKKEYECIDVNDRLNEEEVKKLGEFSNIYNEENIKKLDNLISRNSFISYFTGNEDYDKDGWIDFENEIANLINLLIEMFSKDERKIGKWYISEDFEKIDNIKKDSKLNSYLCILKNLYIDIVDRKTTISEYSKENVEIHMRAELDDFIECLNIYFMEFIRNIKIKKYPEQLYSYSIKIDKIINFNYTDTYNKVLKVSDDDSYISNHFIHGATEDINKAKKNESEKNNMVLGINNERDGLDFVYFKKYFQRIQKRTGIEYKKLIDSKSYKDSKREVYIMGHSLDLNDKDIISELILSDAILKTTIYYRNQKEYEEKIINLIKLFGSDKFEELFYSEKIVFNELKEARRLKKSRYAKS